MSGLVNLNTQASTIPAYQIGKAQIPESKMGKAQIQASQIGKAQNGGTDAATFKQQLEDLQLTIQADKIKYRGETGSAAKQAAQDAYDNLQDLYQDLQNKANPSAFNNLGVQQQLRNVQEDFAQFQNVINNIPTDTQLGAQNANRHVSMRALAGATI